MHPADEHAGVRQLFVSLSLGSHCLNTVYRPESMVLWPHTTLPQSVVGVELLLLGKFLLKM